MIDYHRELLADETRTLAYREAIRAVVKPGHVVVDIGAGSGILSFFACEAGAEHVYAIDRGHMADVASFLARHLGFEDRLTVLHAESSAIELPQRADVLVTETMGVLGFDENILGHVVDARRRLLHDGAAIIPQSLTMSVAPVELHETYEKHIAWWSTPRYGFDLSPLRLFASNSLGYVRLDDTSRIATAAPLLHAELATHDSTFVSGRATYVADRDATLHGFGVSFEATLAAGIVIDTRQPTHWSHAFFPLELPLRVSRGDEISLDLETDDGKAWRWRGRAGDGEFDQTNWLAAPPCISSK